MNKKIVIIGGGIAGYSLALELASKDIDIILIEKKKIGGVCLNKGCIPTKSLLYESRKEKDLKKILDKINHNISILRENITYQIKNKKIEYIEDEAKIESESTVYLKNSGKKITFDKLVLAIGSEIVIPSIFKDEKEVITSDTVLELDKIPKDLIIIGGGYIGVEFATIFNQLGSNVTIIEKESSLLPEIDKELSQELTKSFMAKGINIFTGKKIEKIEENVIYLGDEEILYDKILLATGRKSAKIDSNIKFEEKNGFIKTNEYFETSNKNIFVVGDATGNLMFAHKAEYDAKILAKTLLDGVKDLPDYSKIPFCIFSDPQIGIIGVDKAEKIIKISFKSIGKAYCDDSVDGFLKLMIDKNVIVGVHVINKNILEVLSSLIVIINQNLTCEEVSKIIFVHPTNAEIIKEAVKKIK